MNTLNIIKRSLRQTQGLTRLAKVNQPMISLACRAFTTQDSSSKGIPSAQEKNQKMRNSNSPGQVRHYTSSARVKRTEETEQENSPKMRERSPGVKEPHTLTKK